MAMGRQQVHMTPTFPNSATRELRARLIIEEAFETAEALGFKVELTAKGEPYLLPRDTPLLGTIDELAEMVDGCCDVSVVTVGTLSAMGIDDETVHAITDINNLAKFGPGCTIRADGKVIKPPGHKKPDYSSVISGYLMEMEKNGPA